MLSKTMSQISERLTNVETCPARGRWLGVNSLNVGSAGALLFALSSGFVGVLAGRAWCRRNGCLGEQVHDRYGRSLATPGMNVVDTSSEDSFPASDPPSFNAPAATPTQHD
jgi:hypothetical protein